MRNFVFKLSIHIIFIYNGIKTYEELCNTFSNLKYKKTNYFKFLTQNNLQFCEFDILLKKYIQVSLLKTSDAHKNALWIYDKLFIQ